MQEGTTSNGVTTRKYSTKYKPGMTHLSDSALAALGAWLKIVCSLVLSREIESHPCIVAGLSCLVQVTKPPQSFLTQAVATKVDRPCKRWVITARHPSWHCMLLKAAGYSCIAVSGSLETAWLLYSSSALTWSTSCRKVNVAKPVENYAFCPWQHMLSLVHVLVTMHKLCLCRGQQEVLFCSWFCYCVQ